MSRATAKTLCIAILVVALGSTVVAQTVVADESPAEFRLLLLDSGFSDEELAAFADWNGELSEAQAAVASRLLFRLRAVEASKVQVHKLSRDHEVEPGQLVSVEGRVVAATAIELPAAAKEILEKQQLTACTVQFPDGATAVVLSLRVPAAWNRRPPETPLDEPVKLRGVVLGSATTADASQPLVLAQRLQWFPDANVSPGVAWLVQRGFDAALLDEVRHGQRFARPSESLEAQAFYEGLAAIANGEPAELMRLVRDRLPAKAETAKIAAADAADRGQQLSSQLETAPPASKKELQAELAELRRRQAMAAQVVERAALGLSSVWPMFLNPERSTGDVFLIEGTARRAVRIVVDETPAESAVSQAVGENGKPSPGLREYFELDVFTTDSQNQPVICCVVRLPEGFPTGELIREPVRVAGVFFKKWAYARRSDDMQTGGDGRPARLAPPLMLAAEPEWLQRKEPAGPSHRGLWGGGAFVGVLAIIWIVLARVSRRDQLARAQRARYDASLDNLAEP